MAKRRPFGEGDPIPVEDGQMVMGSATPIIERQDAALAEMRAEIDGMRRQIAVLNDAVILLKRTTGVR